MTQQNIQSMLESYRDGNTLDTIGKAFGVTRERVRQLITPLDGHAEAKVLGKLRRKNSHSKTITCKDCGKPMRVYVGSRKLFCDINCFVLWKRKNLDNTVERWCSKCSVVKPISDFYPTYSKDHGFSPYCKKCQAKISNDWRLRHRKQVLKIQARATARYHARIDADPRLRAAYLQKLKDYSRDVRTGKRTVRHRTPRLAQENGQKQA